MTDSFWILTRSTLVSLVLAPLKGGPKYIGMVFIPLVRRRGQVPKGLR